MADSENRMEQTASHDRLNDLSLHARTSNNNISEGLDTSTEIGTPANLKSKTEKEAMQLQKIYNGKPEQLISLLRLYL